MAANITSDVRFDFEGSLRLARSLWAFADDLQAGRVTRDSAVAVAVRSWKGPFGDEFRDRAADEQHSLASLIAALRSDADAWAQAWKDATDEQNRRRWARQVDQIKAERSLLEKVGDVLTGFDYPPQPAPVPKPVPGMFHATCGS